MPIRPNIIVVILLVSSGAATAQEANPDQSATEHVEDAVRTPVRDIGIDKRKIPPKLLAIQDEPYSLTGLSKCAGLITEIGELNMVLGADVNEKVEKSNAEKREETATRVGGGLIGGLIPFRGAVREVSGAVAAERRFNLAVYAGVVRRGFLKGVGLQRGCNAPARP